MNRRNFIKGCTALVTLAMTPQVVWAERVMTPVILKWTVSVSFLNNLSRTPVIEFCKGSGEPVKFALDKGDWVEPLK